MKAVVNVVDFNAVAVVLEDVAVSVHVVCAMASERREC